MPEKGLAANELTALNWMQSSSPVPTSSGPVAPVGELRNCWNEVNGKLLSKFANLSADEWLQRHYAISEEAYAKDLTRTDWLFC